MTRSSAQEPGEWRVLADGRKHAHRSATAWRNLIVIRLVCCCGLRVSEIAALRLEDVVVGVGRSHLRLRRGTKGGKPRLVPLWWDAGTLADLTAWKAQRVGQGAPGTDPFVCSVKAHRIGQPLQRHAVRRRFLSACWVLGAQRVRTLTIHHRRHTFISHALAGGRSLAEVRAAAGHSNVAVTSAYLHVVIDDEEPVGHLFWCELSGEKLHVRRTPGARGPPCIGDRGGALGVVEEAFLDDARGVDQGGDVIRDNQSQECEAATWVLSELVSRDYLAPGPRREEAENLRIHRLLDEANRPFTEQEVAAAGMKAPEIIRPGPLVVRHVHP